MPRGDSPAPAGVRYLAPFLAPDVPIEPPGVAHVAHELLIGRVGGLVVPRAGLVQMCKAPPIGWGHFRA